MNGVDAMWDTNSDEGITIYSLMRDRVLRVRSIAVWGDEEGFGLEYEILPAAPHPSGETDPAVWAAWEARDGWGLSGRDDLGTEYEAPSGAFGPSPDGSTTKGVLDLYPRPPTDATWLDLTFHGYGADHPQYTLRVSLPLPVLTDEEIAKKQGMTESEWLAWAERTRRARQEMDERNRLEE
jgi:hypothetical protein